MINGGRKSVITGQQERGDVHDKDIISFALSAWLFAWVFQPRRSSQQKSADRFHKSGILSRGRPQSRSPPSNSPRIGTYRRPPKPYRRFVRNRSFTIYVFSDDFVDAGGLMSYDPNSVSHTDLPHFTSTRFLKEPNLPICPAPGEIRARDKSQNRQADRPDDPA